MRERGGPRVTILSNRIPINEVLTSMSFDEVFDIVKDTEVPAGDAQELAVEEPDRESMARTVVEAHRTLMAMSEHNRELFCDLVAALEKGSSK
jgi:hypothetical protein